MSQNIQLLSSCDLPTELGLFQCRVFEKNGEELTLISKGNLEGSEHLFTRLHSACFTGEVLGSLKCDCKDQLQKALAHIQTLEKGAVLYLNQEGRGIGLANKIKAYSIQQELHMDTEEANLHLGFPNDSRDYQFASEVLELLKVKSVILNTNNPKKQSAIEASGINISKIAPSLSMPNEHNLSYLKTKLIKHGHRALGDVLPKE